MFALDWKGRGEPSATLLECLIGSGITSFALHQTLGASDFLIEAWLSERARRVLIHQLQKTGVSDITEYQLLDNSVSSEPEEQRDAALGRELRHSSTLLRHIQELVQQSASSQDVLQSEDIQAALQQGLIVRVSDDQRPPKSLRAFIALRATDQGQSQIPKMIVRRIQKAVGPYSSLSRMQGGLFVDATFETLDVAKVFVNKVRLLDPTIQSRTALVLPESIMMDYLDLEGPNREENITRLFDDASLSVLQNIRQAPFQFKLALERRLDERQHLLKSDDDRDRLYRIVRCFLEGDTIGLLESASFTLWIEPLLRNYLRTLAEGKLLHNTARGDLMDLTMRGMQEVLVTSAPNLQQVTSQLGSHYQSDLLKAIRIRNDVAHGRLGNSELFDLRSRLASRTLDDLLCAASIFSRLRQAEKRDQPGSLRLLDDEA